MTLIMGGYETVLKKLKSAKTSDEAAKIFNAEFEVSGVDPSSRQTNAKKILQKYGDNAAGSGTGTDCGATGDCTATKPVWGSQNGSGDEYSQEQLTKLFGNPGTASSHPEMDKNLTEVKFLGHDVQINKKAAGCLEAVSSQLQGTSYKMRMIGCYRYDSNNGSSNIGLKSYHTYGVACDINWDTNPYIGDGSAAAHDMPDEFVPPVS